jgi:DNA-binding GntR family transcriptional regulator
VFEARRVLEAHVIETLARRLTPAGTDRLRRHVAKERQADAAGNRGRLIRRSGEFHLLLAELAGNRAITGFLRELVSRTSLIIAVYEAPGESCCPIDEHAEVIEMLANRRAKAASQAMLAHLSGIEQRLRLDRLPERTVDLREVLGPRGRELTGRRRAPFGSRTALPSDAAAPAR